MSPYFRLFKFRSHMGFGPRLRFVGWVETVPDGRCRTGAGPGLVLPSVSLVPGPGSSPVFAFRI
ncbi:hypothetical protein QC762_0017330 [Podospora pseudocomata]|uniref:Uncharacterized protein n=2 Tax=Podospora TaxID=5144 RepID=A0ABR0GX89_9PEZI|nr:hypothetical protein QC761_0019890 [Podospora bellae-mahoneyi]KAK4660274.1 hypothetical protein QC762_0017330 [Podospora pseudocomata]